MRTGLAYRISGALAGPDEFAELEGRGMRSIVDLRSEREDRSAVIDWATRTGVGYFNFPIAVGDYSGGRYEGIWEAIEQDRHVEWLRDAYIQLAVDFGPQLAGALERISQGFPCGFGCAAGKDRTGIMTAYLQVLLGASEETAIRSYLEKAPTVGQLRPQLTRLYGIGPDDEIPPGMLHIMVVTEDNMNVAFDAVRKRGGVEAFLTEHGLSSEAVQRLRDALIEPAQTTV